MTKVIEELLLEYFKSFIDPDATQSDADHLITWLAKHGYVIRHGDN